MHTPEAFDAFCFEETSNASALGSYKIKVLALRLDGNHPDKILPRYRHLICNCCFLENGRSNTGNVPLVHTISHAIQAIGTLEKLIIIYSEDCMNVSRHTSNLETYMKTIRETETKNGQTNSVLAWKLPKIIASTYEELHAKLS